MLPIIGILGMSGLLIGMLITPLPMLLLIMPLIVRLSERVVINPHRGSLRCWSESRRS
ncbi:hypothetical protein [Bradyrhizobium sp. 25ACV]